MKIYLAGKVTGIPRSESIEKFEHAETKLKASGHEVINPLKLVNHDTTWE